MAHSVWELVALGHQSIRLGARRSLLPASPVPDTLKAHVKEEMFSNERVS